MHYLHTMVRVRALEASLDFYCDKLGLCETRRQDVPAGRFTLVFLATSEDIAAAGLSRPPEIELTYNWDGDETYQTGRSWGHLAFTVEDIYAVCYAVCEKLRATHQPSATGWTYGVCEVGSPSNYCSRARLCPSLSRGHQCRMSEAGDD